MPGWAASASSTAACSAESSRTTSNPRSIITCAGSPSPASTPSTTSTEPRGRSPLADLVEPVGSAEYDPAEHEAPTRTVAALTLPAIGVASATVRPVGVEPNGEMEIPPADEVGWYRYGAAPGEGSAVLAAHIAYDGVDGVFRRLDRLAPGDEVEVRFDDGTALRYRVRALATYDKDELPDEVFDRDGPDQLVLITCGIVSQNAASVIACPLAA